MNSKEPIDLITRPSTPIDVDGRVENVLDPDINNKRKIDTVDDDDDDIVVNIQTDKRPRIEDSIETVDDNPVIIAEHGDNINRDFPHHHCDCYLKKIGDYCTNCYCSVCDIPAEECKEWELHQNAKPREEYWRNLFRTKQSIKLKDININHLHASRQIYPYEKDIPDLDLKLNIAQKQMLAFADNVEKNGLDYNIITGIKRDTYKWEKINIADKVYGGFISSEMGLGKSGTIVGLVKLNPVLTLIVAPPNLLEQWNSEFKKFAKNIKTRVIYCDNQDKILEELLSYSVIIIGNGSKLHPNIASKIKRVVIDESHLVLGQNSKYSEVNNFIKNLSDYKNVKYKWCVTGTPFENFKDRIFLNQIKFLISNDEFKEKMKNYKDFALNFDLTIKDIKNIMIRVEKNQKIKDKDNKYINVADIPNMIFSKLNYEFNDNEKYLYQIAGCLDNLYTNNYYYSTIDLEKSYHHRMLILENKYEEFKSSALKIIQSKLFCPDSMHINDFYQISQNLVYKINVLVNKLSNNKNKINFIIEKINENKRKKENYKAIIVTSNLDYINFISQIDGVANLYRSKGKNSKKIQSILQKFQEGEYSILICSYKEMEQGINLQNACEIFFIDSSFDDTQYQQSWSRIHRYGTKHKKLQATFVCTKDTISEKIFNFHEIKREGRDIDRSNFFKSDQPHIFDNKITIYRSFSDRNADMNESYGYININKINEDTNTLDLQLHLNCDFKHYSNIKNILVISTFNRNAINHVNDFNDKSLYSLKFDFNDLSVSKHKIEEKFFQKYKNFFDSKQSFNLLTAFTKIILVRHDDTKIDFYKKSKVILKMKCCHCSICSFRKFDGSVDMRFLGEFYNYRDSFTREIIPIEKSFNFVDLDGIVNLKYNKSSRFEFLNKEQIPYTPQFKEYEDAKMVKLINFKLHYNFLSNSLFFEKFRFTEFRIVLGNDVTVGDSIIFTYKNKNYKLFINSQNFYESNFLDLKFFIGYFPIQSQEPINIDQYKKITLF